VEKSKDTMRYVNAWDLNLNWH